MILIEDTRQQAGKHSLKHAYFEKQGIKVLRSKLPVGDYATMKSFNTIIDTKKDIQEIISNVTKQHARFTAECDLAKESNINLIILIENEDGITKIRDLYKWWNPRSRYSKGATSGKTLAKILYGIEKNHGCTFIFCRPEEAGEMIVKILSGGEENGRVYTNSE